VSTPPSWQTAPDHRSRADRNAPDVGYDTAGKRMLRILPITLPNDGHNPKVG
jgi:hypothetical protein